MKNLLFFCLLFPCIFTAYGQGRNSISVTGLTVSDSLYPADAARLSGFIGEKLDLSYQNRILAQDIERLVIPFRNRTESSCWQSEFWGKWFTSALLAYRYRPEMPLKEKLESAVTDLLSTQSPDGYIGNYADDNHLQSWDIWGRKYCMLGLIGYYDLARDSKALHAAAKIADHLITELQSRDLLIVKTGNHRGMAASSVLEPICLLYGRTGNKKYLEFAEEIVRQWESADGPQLISKADTDVSKRFPKPLSNWYGWEQGQKAYEMMSCYEGLLELYRLTGKTAYKDAVVKTWQNIRDNEINIAGSGSAVECWFHGNHYQDLPVHHYQETCVTVTWIKLSQQLLRLTGEPKYADAIEQAYYNALLGAMKTDGSDWAKYTPLSGQRLEGSEQCGMGLNCCVASGPRGLFSFPLTSVMSGKGGIQVNFFTQGTSKLQSPRGQQVEIQQDTDYPVSGRVSMILKLKKPENMTLYIRVPGWSKETSLAVNNVPVNTPVAGTCIAIQRMWKDNDRIELNLDMRGRIIELNNHGRNLAIVRGPVVLCRDSRLAGPALESILTPETTNSGYIVLTPVTGKQNGLWMQFSGLFYPESYAEEAVKPEPVMLCDYASAGNAPDSYPLFKVWLPQLFDPSK